MDHFVNFYKQNVDESDCSMIHFFKRDFSYSIHGVHASNIAQEFYRTKSVLRQENGLDTLTVSRKFFSSIVLSLLGSNKTVQLWSKRSSPNGLKQVWAKSGFASPGYFRGLESELLSDTCNSIRDTAVMAAIAFEAIDPPIPFKRSSNASTTSQESTRIGLSVMSEATNTLTVFEFNDSSDLSRLQSVLCNMGVRECLLDPDATSQQGEEAGKRKRSDSDSCQDAEKLKVIVCRQLLRSNVKVTECAGCRGNSVQQVISSLRGLTSLNRDDAPLRSPVAHSSSKLHDSNQKALASISSMALGAATTATLCEHLGYFQQKDSSSTEAGMHGSVTTNGFCLEIGSVDSFLRLDSAASAALNLFPSASLSHKSNLAKEISESFSSKTSSASTGEEIVDNEALNSQTESSESEVSSAKAFSVFEVINFTKTTMGRRLLLQWLRKPLCQLGAILQRQMLVSLIVDNPVIRSKLRDSAEYLKGCPDLQATAQKLKPPARRASLGDLLTVYRCVNRMSAVARALRELVNETSSEVIILSDDDEESVDVSEKRKEGATPLAASSSGGCANTTPTRGKGVSTLIYDLTQSESALQTFQRLVEEIVDVEALAGGAKDRSMFGSKWIQIRPSFSPRLMDASNKLEVVSSQMADELQKIQNIVSGGDLSSAKPATAAKGRSRSRASAAPTVQLEYNPTHKYHLRVTKKEEAKTMKALKAKNITVQVLANLKVGTLFLTNKMADLTTRQALLRSQYDAIQQEIIAEAIAVAGTYVDVIEVAARALAEIDCICSLAHAAVLHDWCRPGLKTRTVGDSSTTNIRLDSLRHPCIEQSVGHGRYVSSDLLFERGERAAIITGPNMGGKSTYLRAVGIAIVLAQIGSYVPARDADMVIFDRLLVRVGASDSLADGMSTFMAEMNDVSSILRTATPNSIVLIDELGRGTSTHEGFGIAWATLHELVFGVKCTTLFATHFHELTRMEELNDLNADDDLESPAVPSSTDSAASAEESMAVVHRSDDPSQLLKRVVNLCVQADVLSDGRGVVMRYAVERGVCEKSFGIHVAHMAGFPSEIVDEATRIASALESHN